MIWSGTRQVVYTQSLPFVRYQPLKTLEVDTVSPIVSIDTFSLVPVPPTWKLAGWVEIYAKGLFNANHRLMDRQALRLNSANLLHFKDFNLPIPYLLKIDFPKWIEIIQLTIRCYIDQSGKYIDEDIEDLKEIFEGKDYTLSSVTYAPNKEDGTLIDSIFTLSLPMERYRLGRFRDGSGRFLSDPVIQQSPYLLIATFTSESPMPSGRISVNVGL